MPLWFEHTVESIVDDFKKIEKRLHAHAERKTQHAAYYKELADRTAENAAIATAEAERARKVAGKIGSLLT